MLYELDEIEKKALMPKGETTMGVIDIDHLPTKLEQIEARQDPPLRFDYSVECENCGYLKQIAPKLSEQQAQRLLHDQGWRLVDDENRCPTCAGTEEHTPNEGEPHPVTECETRGCVKLRRTI